MKMNVVFSENEAKTDTSLFSSDQSFKAGLVGGRGEDGFSPTIELSRFSGGVRITVTNKSGVSSADVFDGKDVQGIDEYVVLDQADYDALTEKKSTTLYLIRG